MYKLRIFFSTRLFAPRLFEPLSVQPLVYVPPTTAKLVGRLVQVTQLTGRLVKVGGR